MAETGLISLLLVFALVGGLIGIVGLAASPWKQKTPYRGKQR